MSYCALIEFRNGVVDQEIVFLNAWGGSIRLWNSLFNLYMAPKKHEYESVLSCSEQRSNEFWGLWKTSRLDDDVRAAFMFTFDMAVVAKKNFERLASDLRGADQRFAVTHGCVNHLPAVAKAIEESQAEYVGWLGTSVTGNLFTHWEETDDGGDREVKYDLNTGTKHFEVYELIDKWQKERGEAR